MDLSNGYYQDAEFRTYKVTNDCIFIHNDNKFKPLLSYQEFVMQFLNGLLVKKNIVELIDNYIGNVYLVYPDMDAPDDKCSHQIDALRYALTNYEAKFSPDCFVGYDEAIAGLGEAIILPLTPDQEIEYLEGVLSDLEDERGLASEKISSLDLQVSDVYYRINQIKTELL